MVLVSRPGVQDSADSPHGIPGKFGNSGDEKYCVNKVTLEPGELPHPGRGIALT